MCQTPSKALFPAHLLCVPQTQVFVGKGRTDGPPSHATSQIPADNLFCEARTPPQDAHLSQNGIFCPLEHFLIQEIFRGNENSHFGRMGFHVCHITMCIDLRTSCIITVGKIDAGTRHT